MPGVHLFQHTQKGLIMMNRITMTGEIASLPMHIGQESNKHCTFQLNVSHRTMNGHIKTEPFIIHCWGKTAEWVMNNLTVKQRVWLEGYLSKSVLSMNKERAITDVVTARVILPFLPQATSAGLLSSVASPAVEGMPEPEQEGGEENGG